MVLLWNAAHPDRLVLDLGTSLERLAWTRSRTSWTHLVFGALADAAPLGVLDALRTATLLLGSGIAPSARGPGNITRRILQHIPSEAAALGVSRAVRHFHQYWRHTSDVAVNWPEIAAQLDDFLGAGTRVSRGSRRAIALATGE
ncbi:hypothetical protein VSR01_15745 [Actinacidiphila sp. DG2A-62]|uniref:hypothetical protein n=1 Tax=Actinacidiphila sp. DG2A-62 TaxID=3108821 RepID=UPI002DBD08D2|nr:hypothetical protein [Actinacidiphila sp. DG2A-62]MEC3994904.1 hypothetical protein [Actinacidiphila sp. DG2A-62]